MGAIVAVLSKKEQNAMKAAVTMLEALSVQDAEDYGIASATELQTGGTTSELKYTKIKSPAAVGCAFTRIREKGTQQPIILKNGAWFFEGTIYPSSASPIHEVGKIDDSISAYKRILRKEGEYTFAAILRDLVVAGRDPLGIRPLYYGENPELIGLSTERKALWKIGIDRTESFPPGNIGILSASGFHFENVKNLVSKIAASSETAKNADVKLPMLIERSVKQRIAGEREVAVAFSGGLDSSIVAHVAKKFGAHPQLVYVSLTDNKETEYARRMAEELDLPLHVCVYTEESVEKVLPKIVWLIEEPNPIKAAIAIPIFWAAENARKMGLRVMLAGQGADELFGGYERYVNLYLLEGKDKAEEAIKKDILRMHETNFERDFKVSNYNNIELRLPLANFSVASFALNLPLALKIEPNDKTLRKLILRKAAERLGLPQKIVCKPKRAVQYSTGVSEALKKIAKKKGLSVKAYVQSAFEFTIRNEAD